MGDTTKRPDPRTKPPLGKGKGKGTKDKKPDNK